MYAHSIESVKNNQMLRLYGIHLFFHLILWLLLINLICL